MSPRYTLVPVEPKELNPGDHIQTRLNVPGSTYVLESIVTSNHPGRNTVIVTSAKEADSPLTHLSYQDWVFEREELT